MYDAMTGVRTKLPNATWRKLPVPKRSFRQGLKAFFTDRVYGAWQVLTGKARAVTD